MDYPAITKLITIFYHYNVPILFNHFSICSYTNSAVPNVKFFIDIAEPLALRKNDQISELFRSGRKIIKAGGKVIVEQRDLNAAPRTLSVFTTVGDLNKWKQLLSESQKSLNRGPIK